MHEFTIENEDGTLGVVEIQLPIYRKRPFMEGTEYAKIYLDEQGKLRQLFIIQRIDRFIIGYIHSKFDIVNYNYVLGLHDNYLEKEDFDYYMNMYINTLIKEMEL